MIFYTVEAKFYSNQAEMPNWRFDAFYKRVFKTRATALEYFEWLENKADNSNENWNVSIEREETKEAFDLWRKCNVCRLGIDTRDDAEFVWNCPNCGHLNE